MVKLKKYRLRKLVCPTCKGNGFIKVTSFDYDEMIHQCWDCDSEGEFYETSDSLVGNGNSDRNHDIKLH